MSPLVLVTTVLLGFNTSPSSSIYAGYAERPHAAYAVTIAGFEIAEEQALGAVRIAGRVVRPGTYQYCPGMTVSSAIGEAGSFVSGADYENIRVIRATDDGDRSYRLSYHIMPHRLALLKPGDTVVIPDKLRFY